MDNYCQLLFICMGKSVQQDLNFTAKCCADELNVVPNERAVLEPSSLGGEFRQIGRAHV